LVCAAFTDHVVYGGRKGAANQGRKTVKRTIFALELRDMVWALATTGMRPAEYWSRNGAAWADLLSHIHVYGTKTTAAKRPTFSLRPHARPPMCGEQFFRRAFAAATEKAIREGLDVYSLRRTFAALCESARIEPSRARAYLGHGPKTVTDLYLRTNVLPFVEQDAALVSAWIEAERAKANKPSLKLETGK
jgi:integrase